MTPDAIISTTSELEAIDPDQIVAVTTYMAARHAARFQERASAVLAELASATDDRGAGGFIPPFPRNHGPKNPWELPEWTMDDLPAARWLVRDLSDLQRHLVIHLINARHTGEWTNDLRYAAGYREDQSMAGVFRALSGRCRACGRRPFWDGGSRDSERGMQVTARSGAPTQVILEALRIEFPGQGV